MDGGYTDRVAMLGAPWMSLAASLLLGVIACTAWGPVEQTPATEQVRLVRVLKSASMHAMSCNSFFSSVRLANDSERTIRVTAVDLLTDRHHRVPIDLTLPPRSEASFEFGVEPGKPTRQSLKLPGCSKPIQVGESSEASSFVSEAEYLD